MAEYSESEIKALVQAGVDEATDRLAAKNKELLGELKQARKGQEIDPETVTRLESKVHELQDALATAEKSEKLAKAEAEKVGKLYATEVETGKKLAIDSGLGDAIASAKVAPHFIPAVKAMLASKTSLNDERAVMIGDKPLADFVKEWSQSDEGKHYIVAPNNSGGGAGGSGGEGGAKTMARSDFDEKNPVEKMEFVKGGGKIID